MNVDVTNTQEGGNAPIAKPQDFKANIKPQQEEQAQPVVENTTAANPVAETESSQPIQAEAPTPPVVSNIPTEPTQEDIHELPSPVDINQMSQVNTNDLEGTVDEHTLPDILPTDEQKEESDFNFIPADAIQNFTAPKDEEGDTQASGIIVPNIESNSFTQGQEINKLAGINSPTLPKEELKQPTVQGLESEPAKQEEKKIPELTYEQGQVNFKNGTYNGTLSGGVPHGQGELLLNNGTRVAGSFINGVADGSATIISPDGSGYYGGVSNGIANGIGTYVSKDGNTQHGTFKDGKFVAPITEKAEYAQASKKQNNIQTAFKNASTNDYSEVYKDNNVVSPIAKPVQENTAQYAFNAMNKISHKEASAIQSQSGLDITLNKEKELDKVNTTSALKQLNAVLTPEVKRFVASGGKLTPQQKLQIQEALKQYDNSKDKEIDINNPTIRNLHPLAGGYSSLDKKDTATVLKLAYAFAKKGHSYLDELNKPYVKPVNVEEQQVINRKNQINEVKQAINPSTGKVYGKPVVDAVDFISSPKYAQYIKQELQSGDGKVDGAKLQYHLNQAYSQWLKDTGASKGGVSREAFNNTIGAKITKLHNDIISDITPTAMKNPNNFGYAAAQKVIDLENKRLAEAKSQLVVDTHNKVSAYYVNEKTKQEQEIITKHQDTLSKIKQTASSTYQQSLKALNQSNPQIKAVSDDYSQKILQAGSDDEKNALAKEMQSKLSVFPEFQELNSTYNSHLNAEIAKLNAATSSAIIQNSAKFRDAYMKDYSKQYSVGLQGLYKKSGYLAQYNAFANSDKVINSNLYKKASYQEKKQLTEDQWNQHVMLATKYFSRKELRQPANEKERQTKHFSEWTGELKPRTAEDLATYKSMISKGAHDKFRVFMNYNELTNEKQNTFQVKALLEDKLAEANANLEYLQKTLGDNYKHHEDWAKWNDMKRNCEKGLVAPENEHNDMNAFLKGVFEGDVPFLSSIVKIHDANNLSDASERYANGTANRADAGLLMSKNIKDTIDQLSPKSFAHELGTGVSNTVSFMLEMAATSGAGSLGFMTAKSGASGALAMVKKTAEKTALASIIENPTAIARLNALASFAAQGAGQVGKVIAMTTLMPSTSAGIAERYQQKVAPQFYLAHMGGLDPVIAKIDKGVEGWFESGLKAYGISASSVIAEMSGGKLLGAVDNAVQKPIIDYMSTNQFLKRTMIGNYMRKKGFSTTDELENFIGDAMAKGRMTEIHHEIFENWVEQGLTNVVEGEDLKRGFTAKEQGHAAIATALTAGLLKGSKLAVDKGRDILVKSDPVSTNVFYDGAEGEKLTVPMSTDVWNRFNKVVAKKQFDSDKFTDFVEENKLTLAQEQALANVYVKVNPTAHENIEAITNHAKEMTQEAITPDEIMGGNVEVVNQAFEEPKQEEQEDDLTPREREEQEQTNTETNDNQNQAGLPSEIGTPKELVQNQPNQEASSQEASASGMVQEPSEQVNESSTSIDGDDLILHHGSPHDFDKFQLEKIGTGEGAQAFGYGLYFTDGSKIAKSYASKLSEDKTGIIYDVRIKGGRTANWAEWREPLDETQEMDLYNAMTPEQHEKYQAHIDKAFYPEHKNYDPKYEKDYHGAFEELKPNKYGESSYEKPHASGNIYQDLKDAIGQQEATELFKKAKIDGIKYRAKKGHGQETNYVVFNPESISIEKKSNESATPTNTPADGNIQPGIESGTQAGQSEAVRPTTEPATSQGNVEVAKGKGGTVTFADNLEMPYVYKLVESDELQPSHHASGERNPEHTIALAQPKERNDQGSKTASDNIASKINFNRVGESPEAYSGAPVVNSRNEVIQGNNRSIGIKKHYTQGQQLYKQQLENQAEKFGFTKEQVASMKNPVLVRETSVDDNVAIELGQYDVKDLESGGKQRIDAVITSRKLTSQDKVQIASLIFNGEHTTVKQGITAEKSKILNIIKKHINIAQFNTAVNKEGGFTASGMNDVERTIKNMKFDGGSVVLPEIFEELPHNIKMNVDNSLQYIYSVDKEHSILPDIQNAMMAIYEKEQSGQEFDAWANQTDIFTGSTPKELFTPFELFLAKKLTTFTKQKELSVIAKSYAEQVKGKSEDMFSEATPGMSKADAIKNLFNIDYNENNVKPQSKASIETSSSAEREAISEPEVKIKETKQTLITDEQKQKVMNDKLESELQALPIVPTKKNNTFTLSKSELTKRPIEEQNLVKDINENFEDILEQTGIRKIKCE